MVIIIKEGNEDKQGNAVCPQCGEHALIIKHWGDPPSCPKCSKPYEPISQPPNYK